MSDDAFSGAFGERLRRAERLVAHAALDGQCRDWTAERADRVGFARLAQVHQELQQVLPEISKREVLWTAANVAAWGAVAATIMILADEAAAPLTVAFALAGGLLVASLGFSLWRLVRDHRAKRAPGGPAPIDDPHLYADLTRRIEACAAEARSDPDESGRAGADTLDWALSWVNAARDELTTRTSPAER